MSFGEWVGLTSESQCFWWYPANRSELLSKKSPWVLIIAFCTDSRAQLYNWLWNWAFGRLVISTNTSQSVTNLRNFCGVISECNCGGLATGAFISDWEAWGTAALLLRPMIVRISPDTPTPSYFNRGRSNKARLSQVSFSVTKISA